MDGQDFAQGFLVELDKMQNSRVKISFTWEGLAQLLRNVLDPKPAEENCIPSYAPPEIPPEFPKLKVKFGADMPRHNFNGMTAEKIHSLLSAPRDMSAQRWIIVNNGEDENGYRDHGWLTQPMEFLEKLKGDGVPEWKPGRKTGAV